MDACVRKLAASQADLVSAWQLRDLGWTRRMIDRGVEDRGWRVIHRGVYALSQAPLSQDQWWLAATLTAPNSFLSHSSAGARYGFYRYAEPIEMITRPGTGGRRRQGRLVVFRSRSLAGDTRRLGNLPITTPERTMIDLAVRLPDKRTRRMFRESIRLESTTVPRLRATLARHRGQPGTKLLAELVARYGHLPFRRSRSDAECLALEILRDAGGEQPLLNHRVAGEEADLVYLERRVIVEVDGPQYHLFADEDARKQRIWEAAGFEVRRIDTDSVYDRPAELVGLALA